MTGAIALSIVFAGTMPAADPVTGGGWAGQWTSDTKGHHGPMHARVSETSAGDYRVTFHGRFWVVFPFRYTTTLSPVGTGPAGEVYLAGEKRLGLGLGTFSTTAVATPTTFDAEYHAKRDHGRFTLRR